MMCRVFLWELEERKTVWWWCWARETGWKEKTEARKDEDQVSGDGEVQN